MTGPLLYRSSVTSLGASNHKHAGSIVPRRGLNRSLPNDADLAHGVSEERYHYSVVTRSNLLEGDAILCNVLIARLPNEGDITGVGCL